MKSLSEMGGRTGWRRRVGVGIAVAFGISVTFSSQAGLAPGWRFANPLPQGNRLHAAWAAGPNNLFVGGEGGVIMRWNGQTWSAMSTPTQKTIFALDGVSATDLWAVGGDAYAEEPGDFALILHYDGTAWTEMTPPDFLGQTYVLNSVCALAPDDVWATVEMGTQPIHFNGVRWEFVEVGIPAAFDLEGSFHGVGAVNAGHVFFVGSHGQILHKAGDQWTLEQKLEDGGFSVNLLQCIWAPALDQVYVGGNWGQVYRRNADGTWTDLGLGGGISEGWGVRHIWGRSATDIYFLSGSLLRHYDGQNPPEILDFANRKAGQWMAGASLPDRLFAVGGSAGHEFVPNGAGGVLSSLSVSGAPTPYAKIGGLAPLGPDSMIGWGDTSYSDAAPLFIVTEAAVKPFPELPPGMLQRTRISAVNAAGPDDLVVCWDNWSQPGSGVHRWNGAEWTRLMDGAPDPDTGFVTWAPAHAFALWRSPGGTLFAAEPNRVVRLNAENRWETLLNIPFDQQPPRILSALGGRSDTEVYVGTEQGEILRYDGADFVRENTPTATAAVRGLTGRFRVVGFGVILGATGSPGLVNAGAGDVYAVGENGQAWVRGDGAWQAMSGVTLREGDNFTKIVTGDAGVYAFQQTPGQYTGGGLGRLWRLEGNTATRVMAGLSAGNDAVLSTSADGSIYLAATDGTLLTDRPAPANFVLQRLERSATGWTPLGETGVELRPDPTGEGFTLVAAWRADSPSVAPPPELVGDGVPAGQHWVVRSEQWHAGGSALPTARLRLQYDPARQPVGHPTGGVKLLRYDGTVWSAVPADWDPVAHTITTSAPTPLSEWTFVWTGDAPAGPRLSIRLADAGSIRLQWPADASTVQLEATLTLGPDAAWTQVTTPPEIIGGQNTVTLPATGKTRFFRLRE